MPQDNLKLRVPELTELQLKCLEGFWNRKPAKQIAADLGISEAWVHKNLMAVRRQLHVSSSAEAASLVFGSKPGSIKNYYYQETDLSEFPQPMDQAVAGSNALLGSVTGERGLINNLGVWQTLGWIFGVAIGLIAGLLLLLQSALALRELWTALGY